MKRIVTALLLILLVACEWIPEVPPETNPGDGPKTGTLIADFPITHTWIPANRIIRTNLHVARNAWDLYRGNFIQSANVTDSQQKYSFILPPGDYYLEAAIACLCGGDSCSAGGFPGNTWARKYTSYTFTIEEDKITEVLIRFLK